MTSFPPSTARYASGVAVVAGGSGGVGSAICRRLAAAGADIALTYHRGLDRAEKTANDIRALDRKVHLVALDLTDADSVRRFVEESATRFGGIHTAVYAAGPDIAMRHVSAIDPARFREVVSTDLFGCYNFLQASIAELRKTRGAVVALGTPAIRRFAVKDLLSAAPKAAIESVVRAIAAEEGRHGIRANFVGVGVITDGKYKDLVEQGDFTEAWLDGARRTLALRRLGTAVEIADAVEFLASDRASFITGQSLMVDGGYAL